MNKSEFKELFFEVFSQYVKTPKKIEKMYEDVVKKYSSKNRHYHNLNHIIHMSELWKRYKDSFEFPNFAFIAIVYHDIIYNVNSFNNENKSAEYFDLLFHKKHIINIKANEIVYISDLIKYTKHNCFFGNKLFKDIKLFLDLDLAILSSPSNEYLKYSQDIRKEFKRYPNFLYKKGRLYFLQDFLQKENIYLSNKFKKLEKIARKNMENEINYLNSPKKEK